MSADNTDVVSSTQAEGTAIGERGGGFSSSTEKVIRDIEAEAATAYGVGPVDKIDDERAVELLVHTALDKSKVFSVRSDALFALYHIGNEQATGPIARMLLDKEDHEWLRAYAALALGHIGGRNVQDARTTGPVERDQAPTSPRITGPLLQALQDGSMVIKWFVVKALGHLRDPQAVEPLVLMLIRDESHTTNTPDNADFRASIAAALGEIGDKRAIWPLLNMLMSQDGDLRTNAARALGQLHDDQVVDLLTEALHDRSTLERAIAAEALGEICDDEAVEPLIKALWDEAALVRGNAAESLGLLHNEKALPALAWVRENDTGAMPSGRRVRDIADEAIHAIQRADRR